MCSPFQVNSARTLLLTLAGRHAVRHITVTTTRVAAKKNCRLEFMIAGLDSSEIVWATRKMCLERA